MTAERRGGEAGASQTAALCDGVTVAARGQRVMSGRQSSTGRALHLESDTEDAVSGRSTRKSAGEDKAESVESSSLCPSDAADSAGHGWKFSRWLHTNTALPDPREAPPSSSLDGKQSADALSSSLSRLVEAGTGGSKVRSWNLSVCLPGDSTTKDSQRTKLTPIMILVVIFTSLTGLLMGYDLCVVAVVLSEIQKHFQLCGMSFSCAAKSMVVAVLAPGAASRRLGHLLMPVYIRSVGSIAGGWMSDRIGRKPGLALSDVCLLVGSIAMGTGQAFWVTLFGRFVVGMGVGLGFVVYATYTSEVAPPDRRGQLVACQEVAQCFGCLVAYAMAAACGEKAWRYLLGMGGILAAVQILGEVLILPESPRFFVQHGREDDAAASLRKLGMTDPVAVAAVIEEFKAEREQYGDLSGGLEERRTWKASWRQQFEKMQCYRGSLLIAVGCAVAQNFTAANSVIYFTIDIFRLASICDPLLPGVGVGIVKFAGVVVCLFFVDRWGRRFLLLTGTAGTLLCHILMATGFALQEGGMPLAAAAACGGGIEQSSPPYAKLLIVALLIYIFFWNTSWAALMFVVASEVLPNSLRGLGMGLTITTFWIFSFIMQSALEPLFSAITIPGTFALFACLNLLALLFVIFFVPEGKGQALEEVHRKGRPAVSLQPAYRKAMTRVIPSGTASSSLPVGASPQEEEAVPAWVGEGPLVRCVCLVDTCHEDSPNSLVEGNQESPAAILRTPGPMEDVAAVSSRCQPSAAVEKRKGSVTNI